MPTRRLLRWLGDESRRSEVEQAVCDWLEEQKGSPRGCLSKGTGVQRGCEMSVLKVFYDPRGQGTDQLA